MDTLFKARSGRGGESKDHVISFCIISTERVVNLDQIHATLYQHNKERIEKSAIKPNLIRYAETSMKTGFGLKYIYDYLAVPFLQLQVSIKHFQHVQ